MKKAKCIKCGEEIKFRQLMRHSWKKPISCLSCGTKMNFDKKAWLKANTPTSLIGLAILVIIFAGPKTDEELAVYFLALGILLLLVSLLWWFIKIRGIKLVLSNSNKT